MEVVEVGWETTKWRPDPMIEIRSKEQSMPVIVLSGLNIVFFGSCIHPLEIL